MRMYKAGEGNEGFGNKWRRGGSGNDGVAEKVLMEVYLPPRPVCPPTTRPTEGASNGVKRTSKFPSWSGPNIMVLDPPHYLKGGTQHPPSRPIPFALCS
ncbi:unnamed protein product [Allacma fusca]|uniref:Uncharacterized protein n=1 Tax=Allacma fusca TaxID=39272 RepID=A0A8J2NT80_9HEXA|nr:unnamed protein product [Allacma fusca]